MRIKRIVAHALAGLLVGLVGVVVMILLMAASRTWLGVSPPPEAVPDRLAPTLDIETFFELFGRYGGYNGLKKFGVRSGIQALIGAGAVVGVVYGLVSASGRGERARTLPGGISRFGAGFLLITAVVLWVVSLAVLWPVLGANYRGLPPSQARWLSSLTLLAQYLAFGLAVAVTYRFVAGRPHTTADPDAQPEVPSAATIGRRAVLAAGTGALLCWPAYALIRRLYDRATFPYDGTVFSGPTVEPIASNERFYTVTKNVVDPNVARRVWGLEIWGTVDDSMRVDFDELVHLPSVEQETTLMCISNTIGAGLFSNAVWTGVPMATLLERAGVRPEAVEVKLHGADAYTDTFAIEKALDPTTLVAFLMNGEPLPERHGYPARVIVPGLFGEKNVKWVTGIEVIDHDGKGFYEQQGWGPNFVIPTRSDIFSPLWRRGRGGDAFVDPLAVGKPFTVRGRAFAGDRGIASVEVSVDGGESWAPATIDYPGTRLTWTFWSHRWTPDAPGERVIVSRAVDGLGGEQPAESRGIIPQGATGYHRVTATIGG